MSVDFYGKDCHGLPIMLGHEHPDAINMSSGNGRAFLEFLGVEPGPEPYGELPMPLARRAVMRARATFGRRAGLFTRPSMDTQRLGLARVVIVGLDVDYLARRLDDFERFLNAVTERGAVSIYWA
jgi:hypothetical protein